MLRSLNCHFRNLCTSVSTELHIVHYSSLMKVQLDSLSCNLFPCRASRPAFPDTAQALPPSPVADSIRSFVSDEGASTSWHSAHGSQAGGYWVKQSAASRAGACRVGQAAVRLPDRESFCFCQPHSQDPRLRGPEYQGNSTGRVVHLTDWLNELCFSQCSLPTSLEIV